MSALYKISLVSYWNTKPFLYGLQHAPVGQKFELQLDIPSVGGKKLIENKVDIGLVPVAVLPLLPEARIITDYCIGTLGKVKSVCIFSQQPIEEIKKIFLDYHSLTSVQLVKLLLQDYWKLRPELVHAQSGYIDEIENTTAGLVIGDRTFPLMHKFKYVYDLGEAWKNLTGLPFVFAAWITRKDIPQHDIEELNNALKFGVNSIAELCNDADTNLFSKTELKEYLTNNINYNLDSEKRRALSLFLSKIKSSQTFDII